MAIGIDKMLHVRLLAGLRELYGDTGDDHWSSLLEKLEQAYRYTAHLQEMAEQQACLYNEIQANIRSKVANGQRSRKRKERKDLADMAN